MGFSPALTISSEARNVSLSLIQGTFWWTIPNLETSTLRINFLVTSTNLVEKPVDVTFRKGLYSYKEINQAVTDAVIQAGFPSNSVLFRVNGATNRMMMVFTVPCELTFDSSNLALGTLLGFPISVYRYNGSDSKSGDTLSVLEGLNIAAFDTVQYLTVGTSLVDTGFQLNGGIYRGVIAHIGITSEAGYQIVFEPMNPLEVSTDQLSGNGVTRAEFTLMDQDGNLVDTNGQDWSLLLRIRYYL